MAVEVLWHTTDETEVVIAYSGSTVIMGLKDAQALLSVVMTPAMAIHMMMELREALKDLHTEPGEDA